MNIFKTSKPVLSMLSAAALTGALAAVTAFASPAEAQLSGDACETAIHFDFDSARLETDDHRKVDRLAQCIEQSGAEGVYLIGHADRRGSVLYNQELALDRAETLADELRERGVEAQIFLSTADESEADRDGFTADERRVDVQVWDDVATVR